jgi:outer membrane protein assembly factor BamB
VDGASGRQIWKYSTGGPVPSSPAVAGGSVYFGSYDGKFYSVNAQTGKVRWKFSTLGERRFEAKGLHGMRPKNQTIPDPYDVFLSSPVVSDGAVFFGCGDGNLYSLDASSGEVRWKFQTGDVVHASPALSGGVLFFGSWDSFFYAVDAKTGQEKWRFHGGEDAVLHNQVGFQSSPAVVDGVVYTGCRDSNLYALDAETGREKWRFNNALSWVITSPAVSKGKVVFATSDSSLFHVVDATTGKPLLHQQLKAYVFSSPAVVDNVVYVGVLNGTLEARDLETGALLWEFQTETSRQNRGWVLTSDRRFNTPLVFLSGWREAPIVATDLEFGIGSIFSSPIVVKAVVYVGSTDGYLYALG